MDLFTHAMQSRMQSEAPLAARMRPRTLEEFVGQEEILNTATDRCILYQKKTVLFVKCVLEAINLEPVLSYGK